MLKHSFTEIRQDCLIAAATQPSVRAQLERQTITVTGGTGFLGSWLAETVAALNDDYQLDITLHLYSRNIADWAINYPHLARRDKLHMHKQDVRSPFDFPRETNYVIHAAGIPNNRVHSSDPLRVHQTTVQGIDNALAAASRLNGVNRFLNVSSCLVTGPSAASGPLTETACFPAPCGELHAVYREAKRAAESLAAIYRSQFRLPTSTLRPFTFAGPYQELDRPWALNSFLRDTLHGGDIRLHGDGQARRSYLYGSDAAWWTLAALVNGVDGGVYNVGSRQAVTHLDLIGLIGDQSAVRPRVILNTASPKQAVTDDLYPDTTFIENRLGVSQTVSLAQTIDKTWRWFNQSA